MGYDMYLKRDCGNEADNYFRANIAGMHRFLVPAMRRAGMIIECDYEGDWPPVPEEKRDDPTYDHDASEVYLAFVGQQVEARGIPLFKFSSNDGWWVRADECETAIAIYKENGEPRPGEYNDFWDDWIAFINLASIFDGFRVW